MRRGTRGSGDGSCRPVVGSIPLFSLAALSVVVMTCFSPFPTSCSAATEYEIHRLTQNPYEDKSVLPMMSPCGPEFSWRAWDGSDWEISLYDGSHTIPITDNDDDDFATDINDAGHVVWEGTDGTGKEVFLYDGSETRQITFNDYFDLGYFVPKINNAGQILWYAGNGTTIEILLYDGADTIQVAEGVNTFSVPDMNDQGHVVWANPAEDPYYYAIYLYDGSQVIQLTDGDYQICYLPRISNNGYVTWEAVTYIDVDIYAHEVILYDGETEMQISDKTVFEGTGAPVMWPRIDRNGNVFWSEPDHEAQSSRILMYDGNQVNELAVRTGDCSIRSNDYDWNSRGEIVFVESCGDHSSVFFSDGSTEIKIVDDSQIPPPVCCAQISDTGLIVWGGRDIYAAAPADSYLATANAEASSYGSNALRGSGVFNSLALLLIPAGGGILVRLRRRRKREFLRCQ